MLWSLRRKVNGGELSSLSCVKALSVIDVIERAKYSDIMVNASGPQDEGLLVAGLKRGDERAFEALVRHNQNKVYGLCLRLMGNPEEAEDLAQDVFLTVYRAIGQFRGESRLSTWIYRITRNHCLNRIKFLKRRAHQRKQSLDVTRQADLSGQQLHRPVGSVSVRPDRLAEGKQLELLIQEQINELSDDHKELIVLRDLEQMSYEEIQTITGLALGTIKSRLHRARVDLARRLSPHLEET